MSTLENTNSKVDTRPTRRDALAAGLGVLSLSLGVGILGVVEVIATQRQRTDQEKRMPAPPKGSNVPVLSQSEILENRDCLSGEWAQTDGFARFDQEIERIDISGIKGITQSVVSQYKLYESDGVDALLLGRFWRLEVWPGGGNNYRGLDATEIRDIVIKVE